MMEIPEETLEKIQQAGGTLMKPGEGMDMEQLKALQQAQQPSAQDISQGMRQGFEAIKEMRADADVAKRMEIVETCKADANRELTSGSPGKALKSYLVAIWLLMRGDPEPTRALVAPVAVERDGLLALGAGSDGILDDEAFGESYAQQVRELRTALHTNVAAAALKLNMWPLASEACKVVLKEQPDHPKALFRLAKAGEGSGDLGTAIATLGKLLKAEGQGDNLEARKLLQVLRNRKSKEAKIYGGFFDRVREEGGSMYDDRDGETQKSPEKSVDLKNLPGEQDKNTVENIIKSRMSCLPEKVQTELKQMKKVGIAPTEIVKAYRRFLKEELKRLREECDEEEQVLIDNVMQATERKMEFIINKVRSQMTARMPKAVDAPEKAKGTCETDRKTEEIRERKDQPTSNPTSSKETLRQKLDTQDTTQEEKHVPAKVPQQSAATHKAESPCLSSANASALTVDPRTETREMAKKEEVSCFRWFAQKVSCCAS